MGVIPARLACPVLPTGGTVDTLPGGQLVASAHLLCTIPPLAWAFPEMGFFPPVLFIAQVSLEDGLLHSEQEYGAEHKACVFQPLSSSETGSPLG